MIDYLFNPPTLGVVLVLVTVFGYISNWLNGRFLNFRFVHLLYYIGALVHETSHAVFCLLTGAQVLEYKVFVRQPHVVYAKSRLPILGNVLISLAPILGGLLFLYLLNIFVLKGHFIVPQFSTWEDLLPIHALALLTQLNPLHWQSWVIILLCLNIGAMIGPSLQDLKNIVPALVVLLFIKSAFLSHIGLLALMLIGANIAIQIILIILLYIISSLRNRTI